MGLKIDLPCLLKQPDIISYSLPRMAEMKLGNGFRKACNRLFWQTKAGEINCR